MTKFGNILRRLRRYISIHSARRAGTNLFWSIISDAIGKGSFFFANVYLARVLGVEKFGLFTLAQTFTYYFWLSVDLGINMYGVRELAKQKENRAELINALMTIRLSASIFVFILYITSIFYFIDLDSLSRTVYLGCGLYLLTYALYTDWVFRGVEMFRYIALGNVVNSFLFLVSIMLLVKSPEGITTASFAWSISYSFGTIVLLLFMYKKIGVTFRPYFNYNLWIKHIKESIFFTITGLSNTLSKTLPILLLGIYTTNYDVGIFSAPYKIINTLCNIGIMFPMAFYPILTENYQNNLTDFIKNMKIQISSMAGMGLVISLTGFAFSKEILNIVLGHSYINSNISFQLLMALVFLIFVRFSIGVPLLAMGLQRSRAVASTLGLCCCGVLSLILIPRYSTTGACISLIISELFVLIALSLVLIRKKQALQTNR